MCRRSGVFFPILASLLLSGIAVPARAQPALTQKGVTGPATAPASPSQGRNVTATGKTMPPATGRGSASGASTSASVNAEMLKAQKAAEARNKEWDSRMRKTIGSICSGC